MEISALSAGTADKYHTGNLGDVKLSTCGGNVNSKGVFSGDYIAVNGEANTVIGVSFGVGDFFHNGKVSVERGKNHAVLVGICNLAAENGLEGRISAEFSFLRRAGPVDEYAFDSGEVFNLRKLNAGTERPPNIYGFILPCAAVSAALCLMSGTPCSGCPYFLSVIFRHFHVLPAAILLV